MNCRNCFRLIANQERTTNCDSCQGKMHIACVGFTDHEFVTTRQKSKSIKFVCNSCSTNMSQFKDLKGLITSIQTEFMCSINKLREEFNEQMQGLRSSFGCDRAAPVSAVQFEEVVQEINDRRNRENNVMVFGVVETSAAAESGGPNSDDAAVSDVVHKLIPSFEGEMRVVRVGRRRSDDGKPRPVKVTFSSRSIVSELIRKAKGLKDCPEYARVSVAYDRTPRQMQYFREVKDDMKRRMEAGEADLRIRYFNGIPRVISTSNPDLN